MSIRRMLMAAVVAIPLFGSSAQAGPVSIGIGINLGGPRAPIYRPYAYGPAYRPYAYGPRPVVVAAPVVVQPPPRVIYTPAPVVIQSPPVYVQP